MNSLHFGAMGGHVSIVNFLLTFLSKDQITKSTSSGQTALHKACSMGRLEVVNILLLQSGNINLQDKNGLTPLHLAASAGSHSIVQLLCNQPGIEVMLEDVEGDNAEDAAVKASKNGFSKLASFLTRVGYVQTRTKSLEKNCIF